MDEKKIYSDDQVFQGEFESWIPEKFNVNLKNHGFLIRPYEKKDKKKEDRNEISPVCQEEQLNQRIQDIKLQSFEQGKAAAIAQLEHQYQGQLKAQEERISLLSNLTSKIKEFEEQLSQKFNQLVINFYDHFLTDHPQGYLDWVCKITQEKIKDDTLLVIKVAEQSLKTWEQHLPTYIHLIKIDPLLTNMDVIVEFKEVVLDLRVQSFLEQQNQSLNQQ